MRPLRAVLVEALASLRDERAVRDVRNALRQTIEQEDLDDVAGTLARRYATDAADDGIPLKVEMASVRQIQAKTPGQDTRPSK